MALRFCCGLQAVVEAEGCVLRRHQSLLNTQAHTNKVLSDSQEEEEILTPPPNRNPVPHYEIRFSLVLERAIKKQKKIK